MKTIAASLGAIVAILLVSVLVIGMTALGMYNSVISADNHVDASWGQVQTAYQRRSDLVPQLVATVKGASQLEKDILIEVSKARASVGQIKVDPTTAPDPATLEKYAAAQGQLGTALSRLLMVQEKYPELKSVQNFSVLQAQLEGTENRVATERHRFNESVLELNNKVRTFPSSFFANMAGVHQRPFFAAEDSAQKAPEVKF